MRFTLINSALLLTLIVGCNRSSTSDRQAQQPKDLHQSAVSDFQELQFDFKRIVANIKDEAAFDEALSDLERIANSMQDVESRLAQLKEPTERDKIRIATLLLTGNEKAEPSSHDVMRFLSIRERSEKIGSWLERVLSAGVGIGREIDRLYEPEDRDVTYAIADRVHAEAIEELQVTGRERSQHSFQWLQVHFFERYGSLYRESFRARAILCCRYPRLAEMFQSLVGFSGGTRDERAQAQKDTLELDNYAREAFTKEFSEAVLVTEFDNQGGIKTLTRYWETPGGYLSLIAGVDVRNYFLRIGFESTLPEREEPLERRVESPSLSKRFLDDFEVVLRPLGRYVYSDGQLVESPAEQAGADQPATKPADKVPAKDQPSTPTSKDSPR